jgi:hypothetical protein
LGHYLVSRRLYDVVSLVPAVQAFDLPIREIVTLTGGSGAALCTRKELGGARHCIGLYVFQFAAHTIAPFP